MQIMPVNSSNHNNRPSFQGNYRGIKIADKAADAVNKLVKELRIIETNPNAERISLGNVEICNNTMLQSHDILIKDGNSYSQLSVYLDKNNKINTVSVSREMLRNPHKIFFRCFCFSKGEVPEGRHNPSIEYATHELTNTLKTHKRNNYHPGMEVPEDEANAITKLVNSTLKLMGINK